MKNLILFLVLTAVCFAGDYKSCVINYKTNAGLCKQIEDVLNVVDTISLRKVWRGVDTTYNIPAGYWQESFYPPKLIFRQYKGLAFESVPEFKIAKINTVLIDTFLVQYGKAILIYEEVKQ